MQRPALLPATILAVAALAGFANATIAQEVTWRHDYASARKEATETGKPLLMDFGTEACVWCRKLDATTFRDPRIAKLLNERFVPVKIDANREMRLTQALAIDSYPTIVLASSEGKILGRHVGYAEIQELNALLAKAPPRQESKLIAPPPAAENAGLFAQARADFEIKRYAECLRQCNLIMAAFPTSPEAHEARQLAQQIAQDPVATRLVRDQINASLTNLQPKLAAALER
jgi:thioredoxin-like negative regulator of GroEL